MSAVLERERVQRNAVSRVGGRVFPMRICAKLGFNRRSMKLAAPGAGKVGAGRF